MTFLWNATKWNRKPVKHRGELRRFEEQARPCKYCGTKPKLDRLIRRGFCTRLMYCPKCCIGVGFDLTENTVPYTGFYIAYAKAWNDEQGAPE